MSDYKFLEPWIELETGEDFVKELNKELTEGHLLYGKSVKAIARRVDNDDVLFKIDDDKVYFAVVHLTWLMKREMNPIFPRTKVFEHYQDFHLKMLEDNKQYE